MRPSHHTQHAARIAERRAALAPVLDSLVPADGRFVWEVGSGHGHFLTAFARAHPGSCFVGIDIASDRVARALRKKGRENLGNLHFVRADAEDFLAAMPARSRFEAIYILFPDPWPKRRHHKNRLVTDAFLFAAAAACSKGARLYLRTDHLPYFSEAAALIAAHPSWSVEDGPWPFDEPTVFQRRASGHYSLVASRR